MKLDSYKKLLRIVTFSIAIIVAFGVVLNNLIIPLSGVIVGFLVLYLGRQSVKEVDRDERTSIISQKASTATLSVSITVTALLGIGLVFLSRAGYLNYEDLGFLLAMQSLIIMSLKVFFDWYYRNRLGG